MKWSTAVAYGGEQVGKGKHKRGLFAAMNPGFEFKAKKAGYLPFQHFLRFLANLLKVPKIVHCNNLSEKESNFFDK